MSKKAASWKRTKKVCPGEIDQCRRPRQPSRTLLPNSVKPGYEVLPAPPVNSLVAQLSFSFVERRRGGSLSK